MSKGVSGVLKVVGVVTVGVLGVCALRRSKKAESEAVQEEYLRVCEELRRLESFDCTDLGNVSDKEVERVGVLADRVGELRERKKALETQFVYLNIQ